MKRLPRILRALWRDFWAGDPPVSVTDWLRRVFTPMHECHGCWGIGEVLDDDGGWERCRRCNGRGLE